MPLLRVLPALRERWDLFDRPDLQLVPETPEMPLLDGWWHLVDPLIGIETWEDLGPSLQSYWPFFFGYLHLKSLLVMTLVVLYAPLFTSDFLLLYLLVLWGFLKFGMVDSWFELRLPIVVWNMRSTPDPAFLDLNSCLYDLSLDLTDPYSWLILL